MTDYECRYEHNVTHFHVPLYGGNGKCIAIALHEPDKKNRVFLTFKDGPKITETDYDPIPYFKKSN